MKENKVELYNKATIYTSNVLLILSWCVLISYTLITFFITGADAFIIDEEASIAANKEYLESFLFFNSLNFIVICILSFVSDYWFRYQKAYLPCKY